MEYYHFAVKMSFCYLSVFCVSSCSSVLVAFGEISMFAGALFGVDYSYKFKINNHE